MLGVGGYDGVRCFDTLDVLDLVRRRSGCRISVASAHIGFSASLPALLSFDQDTMTWLQPRVSGAIPMARNAQTVTVVGNKLFLFGGHSGGCYTC